MYSDREYRAELDGLRALSILLVVAFHARLSGFGGGYVGVDVFFVISGYLITRLLVDEFRNSGAISLRNFYARRIRRLLPLAVVVLLVTLCAGFVLLSPLSRLDLLRDARAAALYMANWRFAGEATAYSGADVTNSLFLHYWSLAVEEQFYIVWPILIVLVGYVVRRWWPTRFVLVLRWVLGVVVVASLGMSAVLTEKMGPASYYVSHTRVWELGAGGLLSLSLGRAFRLHPRFADVMGLFGLFSILVASSVYDETTRFPGVTALLPVLGAAAIIVATTGANCFIGRVLAARPLPFVGRISYAWYLWHWPAMAIGLLWNERWGDSWPQGSVVALAIIVSLALAVFSHAIIEEPLRHASWLRSYRRSFSMGALATGVPLVAVATMWIVGDTGDRQIASSADQGGVGSNEEAEESQLAMTPQEAAADSIVVGPEGCHLGQDDVEPKFECVLGDPDGEFTAMLFGDSHARHWLPALASVGESRGWRILSVTKSACTPIDVHLWNTNFQREYTECKEWRSEVFEGLNTEVEVDLVVISKSYGYSSNVLSRTGERVDAEEIRPYWKRGAERTFNSLLEAVDSVVVLRETPWSPEDVPTCLSEAARPSNCNLSVDEHGGRDANHFRFERDVAPENVRFVDPTPLVCGARTCSMVTEDGIIKYSDRHHLTQTFSRTLGPGLGSMLSQATVVD